MRASVRVTKAGASSRTSQGPGPFGVRRLAAALQSAALIREDQTRGQRQDAGLKPRLRRGRPALRNYLARNSRRRTAPLSREKQKSRRDAGATKSGAGRSVKNEARR